MKHQYDLFISYSSLDSVAVDQLEKRLLLDNYKVWRDNTQIQVGQGIGRRVNEGLERSTFVAVWLSKNSIRSRYVLEELHRKMHEGIYRDYPSILPLLSETCKLPYFLKDKLYADFTTNFDNGYLQLKRAVDDFSQQQVSTLIDIMIEGSSETEHAARKLARLAVKFEQVEILDLLWTAANKTSKPYSVNDHIAYYITQICLDTSSKKIRAHALSLIRASIKSSSRPIVEKFAYAAADLAIKTEDKQLREEALGIVTTTVTNGSDLARYEYAKELARLKEQGFVS